MPLYQQIILSGLIIWVCWNFSNVLNDLIEIMGKYTRRNGL